jgi:cell division protein FtsB
MRIFFVNLTLVHEYNDRLLCQRRRFARAVPDCLAAAGTKYTARAWPLHRLTPAIPRREFVFGHTLDSTMEPAKIQTRSSSAGEPAQGATTIARPATSQEATDQLYHQERRKHRRHSKRMRYLQLITLMLAVTLTVVFIGWINTWVNLEAEEKDRYQLAADLRRVTEERDILIKRNEGLEERLKALVDQRLPGLHPLHFGTTVPIDNGYVRNISFNRTGVGKSKRFEYNLVLENRTQEALIPKIRILLFDESGIQSGSTTITKEAATSNAYTDFLQPGEIRAYTAPMKSDQGRRPIYFQIYAE